jgi:AraC family transcriptional activator of pobA
MIEQIPSLRLYHNDLPASFVIKKMEDIHRRQGGIADPPHRHDYYTIIWPVGARGTHIVDFKEYAIVPDALFFVSPQQMHQIRTDNEPEPTGFVILFTPEFLLKNSISETFISNLKLFSDIEDTPPLEVSGTMRSNLWFFIVQIWNAFNETSELHMEKIGAYLKLFLIECNNHCSLTTFDNPQIIEVGKSITQKFKNLVELHYSQWHQVQQYADNLNITPNYLNEVIRASVKKTAKEYIQNRLILEAKRQYLFTEKSIKEIGFSLGFDDPSHFSKFFKSYTGLTLIEFKDSVQKG